PLVRVVHVTLVPAGHLPDAEASNPVRSRAWHCGAIAMWAHVVVLFEMPLARNRHAPRADCGKRPFFPPREPLLLRLFSDDVDAGASAARASREMSYGGGYGGYGGGGYGGRDLSGFGVAPPGGRMGGGRGGSQWFGVDGGAPGAVGLNWAEMPDGARVDLKGFDEIDLPEGAVYGIATPGGGGWGKP
ncbi:MAG: hypothetical protein ACPG61_03985, partial [Paracoccaceae bacterium]